MDIKTYEELKEQLKEFEECRNNFAKQKAELLNDILSELFDLNIKVIDKDNPDFYINKIYYDDETDEIMSVIRED